LRGETSVTGFTFGKPIFEHPHRHPMPKIALIQQTASEDIDNNFRRGHASAIVALENGADIICFAELAFEPFYPQHPATPDSLAHARAIPNSITDAFAKLAKKHKSVIVLNQFERCGNDTFDSSPVIDADGSILGITRMIHITDYPCFHEKGFYAPGDLDAPVFETAHGKIGVAICYDRHFPEYMRHLGIQGAQLVLLPQAGATGEWPDGLYEAELRVSAFQNGYFTALCNRVGQEQNLQFAGESFVCDPNGQVLARAGTDDEILYCEVDFDQIESSNAKRLFYPDRRPNLYSKWFCDQTEP